MLFAREHKSDLRSNVTSTGTLVWNLQHVLYVLVVPRYIYKLSNIVRLCRLRRQSDDVIFFLNYLYSTYLLTYLPGGKL